MIRYPFENIPPEGEAVQVAEGVLWMRLPLPMALDHVNVYALDDGDGWTVIDSGFASRRTKAIWDNLDEMKQTAVAMKSIDPANPFIGANVPLHPGAARYYQEAGIAIPERLMPK